MLRTWPQGSSTFHRWRVLGFPRPRPRVVSAPSAQRWSCHPAAVACGGLQPRTDWPTRLQSLRARGGRCSGQPASPSRHPTPRRSPCLDVPRQVGSGPGSLSPPHSLTPALSAASPPASPEEAPGRLCPPPPRPCTCPTRGASPALWPRLGPSQKCAENIFQCLSLDTAAPLQTQPQGGGTRVCTRLQDSSVTSCHLGTVTGFVSVTRGGRAACSPWTGPGMRRWALLCTAVPVVLTPPVCEDLGDCAAKLQEDGAADLRVFTVAGRAWVTCFQLL